MEYGIEKRMAKEFLRSYGFLKGDMPVGSYSASVWLDIGMITTNFIDILERWAIPNIGPHRDNGIHIVLKKMIWPLKVNNVFSLM